MPDSTKQFSVMSNDTCRLMTMPLFMSKNSCRSYAGIRHPDDLEIGYPKALATSQRQRLA